MSILEEIFFPSARHREEEKHRLEWTRDEEGEGDPYRGPIDLDSGVVRIRAAAAPEAPAPEAAATEAPVPKAPGPEAGTEAPPEARPAT
ncbi:DUF6191 domain-containing protein [Streptomyces sp. HPF1205]|uniref:DUF6191 domain-containing protein n=1 Tax=Streptomyces sp. HPF1205 TaxID=2873262 RepID=UPI001CECAF77|nr:DUF6191 domain-containing protein [Streptomyces sp. HPF1205]